MDTVKTERVKTTMPLPFFADGRAVKCWDHGHAYTVARIDPNDRFTRESRPDFAEYIATACNSYRDLLAACRLTLRHMYAEELDAPTAAELEHALQVAIAKAEGGDTVTTEQQQTRQTRYADVLAAHKWQGSIGLDIPDEPEGRFVLVQRSRNTGLYWVDFADTLQAVINSHDSDECPEDWPIEYALDLSTGERYRVAGIRTETSMELAD